MKCKFCDNAIPDGSIFCMFCGKEQKRRRADKNHVRVPEPHQCADGSWSAQVMRDGERRSIKGITKEEYYAKATAYRSGLLEIEEQNRCTLERAMSTYIDNRKGVLSPSTIRGYEIIASSRFKKYHHKNIHDINWQKMISEESKLVGQKTVKNAWLFVVSCLKEQGVKDIKVTLPQAEKKDEAWLDYKQIQMLLDNCKGYSCEMAVLLGLHGLRRSELIALEKSSIYDGVIHVRGAIVRGSDGYVRKKTNKNMSSTRDVPIFIPRLQELVDAAPDGQLVTMPPNHLYTRISEACDRAGLEHVGVHGLRRSFCSLCYHLKLSELETMKLGGWSDYKTMRDIYTKLSESDYSFAVSKLKSQFT